MTTDTHGFFKVGQNIILLNNNHEVLIIQEKFHNPEHRWNWPGGRLKEGEDWKQGLRREIQEELGFNTFDIIGIHSVRTWVSDSPHYSVLFVGRILDDVTIRANQNEIADYAWVSSGTIGEFEYQHKGMKRDIIDILNNYATR